MKKNRLWILLGLVVLVAALSFTGCGKDGKAYGSFDWSLGSLTTSGLYTTGGFPSNATYGVDYSFSEGSYFFYYYIYYYGSYYPSGSVWYEADYTVKYNTGSLFSDGSDKHFEVYCTTGGPSITGLNRVGPAPSASEIASGAYSETFGNDSMTVTLNVKRVSASEVPKDGAQTFTK